LRLPGRIAPPPHRPFLPGAQPPLQRRCPIVNARALVPAEVFEIETAIPGAAGDNDAAGADAFLVGESNLKASPVRSGSALQAPGFVRDRHLGSEFLRL